MNKDRRIDVKVTQEQFDALTAKAKAQNMNLSEYMLFCGMNAQISVNIGKMSAFDTFEYELKFLQKMREGNEITADEHSRLKAALIEKYSKTDGQ